MSFFSFDNLITFFLVGIFLFFGCVQPEKGKTDYNMVYVKQFDVNIPIEYYSGGTFNQKTVHAKILDENFGSFFGNKFMRLDGIFCETTTCQYFNNGSLCLQCDYNFIIKKPDDFNKSIDQNKKMVFPTGVGLISFDSNGFVFSVRNKRIEYHCSDVFSFLDSNDMITFSDFNLLETAMKDNSLDCNSLR